MSSYLNHFTNSQQENPNFHSVRVVQRLHTQKVHPLIIPAKTMANISRTKAGIVWNVERLNEIPSFYFLLRSHITISGFSSNVIAERIVNAMRELSIFAIFDTENANLRATTWDGVEFKINLFKSKTDDSVLLEFQKLCGDSVSFRGTRTAIFRAAKGLPPLPELQQNDLTPLMQSTEINILSSEEQKENVTSILEQCEAMLMSDSGDTKLLGIQMLRSMTDSSNTIRAVALFTAKVILGEKDEHRELSNKIFSFLKCDALERLDNYCLQDTKYSADLSYQVLHVLTNALTLLDREGGDVLKKMLETRADLCNELVTLLIIVVGEARNRPHDAWQSAMALDVLVRNSPSAYSRAVESDAFYTLTMSRRIGECAHRMLAVESTKALGSIGCT